MPGYIPGIFRSPSLVIPGLDLGIFRSPSLIMPGLDPGILFRHPNKDRWDKPGDDEL